MNPDRKLSAISLILIESLCESRIKEDHMTKQIKSLASINDNHELALNGYQDLSADGINNLIHCRKCYVVYESFDMNQCVRCYKHYCVDCIHLVRLCMDHLPESHHICGDCNKCDLYCLECEKCKGCYIISDRHRKYHTIVDIEQP